jgi:hypothetical protein
VQDKSHILVLSDFRKKVKRTMTTTKKAPRYAEGTKVSTEKSRIEVQKLLTSYGATNSAHGEQQDKATILFTMKGRQYRIELSYPSLDDFAMDRLGRRRLTHQRVIARDQEIRRLWRALYMVVKAKLEAAQSGIVTLEEEFLAHAILRNEQTVSEWVEPQFLTGKVPLLPEVSSASIPDLDFTEGEWKQL